MGFTCSVCGAEHDTELLDIRMGLPDAVFALSEEERDALTARSDDTCVLLSEPPRFYTRALLEIPVPELGTYFGYGIWAEVAEPEFRRLGELWDDPRGADEPPFEAVLANELAPYANTVGLPLRLQLREDVDKLPAAELAEAAHQLALDQRRGIAAERAHELAAAVGH